MKVSTSWSSHSDSMNDNTSHTNNRHFIELPVKSNKHCSKILTPIKLFNLHENPME